jgi:branched-chain amino acid transport system substrate-binding protein
MKLTKKLLSLTVAASVFALAAPAMAEDVTLGFIGGFTGPIEQLTPPIFAGAELAAKNVNDQGGILGGKLSFISADGACDATQGGVASDKLVNTDKVTAIVGALCSGESTGAFNGSPKAAGVVMVSPASTSPALSTIEDNDQFFRVVPSDAFQGQELAKVLLEKGIKDIAVTFVNNDYGNGFATALSDAFTAGGGKVAASVSHEDGKADYRAELGQLAGSGSQNLVILAYESGSGQVILRQAVESGDFTLFVGGDGMVGNKLLTGIDPAAVQGMIATRAGAPAGAATDAFAKVTEGVEGIRDDKGAYGTYVPQGYDAAFLLALAIEKNGNAGREGLNAALRDVASAPGEKIYPGEWSKALELIKAGTDIDYEGAGGSLDFDANGDVDGIFFLLEVDAGQFVEKGAL